MRISKTKYSRSNECLVYRGLLNPDGTTITISGTSPALLSAVLSPYSDKLTLSFDMNIALRGKCNEVLSDGSVLGNSKLKHPVLILPNWVNLRMNVLQSIVLRKFVSGQFT